MGQTIPVHRRGDGREVGELGERAMARSVGSSGIRWSLSGGNLMFVLRPALATPFSTPGRGHSIFFLILHDSVLFIWRLQFCHPRCLLLLCVSPSVPHTTLQGRGSHQVVCRTMGVPVRVRGQTCDPVLVLCGRQGRPDCRCWVKVSRSQ